MYDTDTATEAKQATRKESARRPVLAVIDHPVDPTSLMLDADDLAGMPDNDVVEYAQRLTIQEARAAIHSLQHAANEHDDRAARARGVAELLRTVLHDTANGTELAAAAIPARR